MYNLAFAYLSGVGVAQDREQGLALLHQAVEAGDSNAMYAFGCLYEFGGDGLPQDNEKALMWYRKAAETGNENAVERLKDLTGGAQ